MLGVFSGQAEASEELLEAARDFETETVKRLLAAGADVNYQDENGDTALMMAMERLYSLDNIKLLLEAGADVHLQDKDGDTALLTAAYGGDFEMAGEGYGEEYEYAKAAGWVLAAGADINHQNKDGRTALQIAVKQGFGETVLVGRLLAAGANINHQDKDGRTALHLAANMEDRIAYWDICGSGGCSSEPNPENNGYPETLRRLIAAGADVNLQDKDGRTALHLAAKRGYSNAVKSLLAAPGVELRLRDKDGHTALHLAESSFDAAAAELLRDATAKAEEWGNSDWWQQATPVAVQEWLDRGANLTEQDAAGNTPLHVAAQFTTNPAVVALLLDRGAEATVYNNTGQLPVELAEQNKALQGTDVRRRLRSLSRRKP